MLSLHCLTASVSESSEDVWLSPSQIMRQLCCLKEWEGLEWSALVPVARLAVPVSAEPHETSQQRKCLGLHIPPFPWRQECASFSFLWVNSELLLRPSCTFISVGVEPRTGWRPAWCNYPGVEAYRCLSRGAPMTGREGSAGTLTVTLNTSGLLTDVLKWEKWLVIQIIPDLLVRTCYWAEIGNLMHGLLFSLPPCTKEAI